MSNSLFMDESNGNGVFASKSNNPATTPAPNSIKSIINAATSTLPSSVSNEDLSQSLSEYTDADESISAPTEFLAEFLSAVMLKDYKKALKYCKLILRYEPNNATAREFCPLILDKLKEADITNSDSDENYNKSSSPEMGLELQLSTEPSAGDSDEASEARNVEIDADEYAGGEDNSSGGNISSCSGMAGESISDSIEDDEDEDDVENVDDEDDEEDDDEVDIDEDEDEDDNDNDVAGDGEEDDANSSSGDDLPIDGNNLLCDESGTEDAGSGIGGNDSNSSRNSSSGGEGRSRSDNTTHSYSSLLLEEEEVDLVPTNLSFCKDLTSPDLDVSNGNKISATSCSDSESPTEPLTQRLAAILRSKCGVNSKGENY